MATTSFRIESKILNYGARTPQTEAKRQRSEVGGFVKGGKCRILAKGRFFDEPRQPCFWGMKPGGLFAFLCFFE